MKIEVLGTGCANCTNTMNLIEKIAKETNTQIELVKVEDLAMIMQYGVMTTPGVVIDGNVVHAGGIPSTESITAWLKDKADANNGDCCSGGACC